MKHKERWILIPAIIALLVSIPSWTHLSSTAYAGFFNHDLETFEEIIELVSEKYVYSPDHKKTIFGRYRKNGQDLRFCKCEIGFE